MIASPRIGIITFEQMRSETSAGSSRIRARWITNHWPDAELFVIGRKYDVVIFQKAYWLDYARTYAGVKILDLCDPDFFDWRSPCIEMADLCDAITVSTSSLGDMLSRYTKTPIYVIPDRVDLDFVRGLKKNHSGQGQVRTAGWFGYSSNFASLDAAITALVPLGITNLLVMTTPGQAYRLPASLARYIKLTNYEWNETFLTSFLLGADVVLNFRLDHGRWKYKSNNKTILSWSLGLPVAHSRDELATFTPETARISEGDEKFQLVRSLYDIKMSIEDYKKIIERYSRACN